jgi:hypothetical protein
MILSEVDDWGILVVAHEAMIVIVQFRVHGWERFQLFADFCSPGTYVL